MAFVRVVVANKAGWGHVFVITEVPVLRRTNRDADNSRLNANYKAQNLSQFYSDLIDIEFFIFQ